MSVRFAVRDDDVCFHTNVDALRSLYADVIRTCPISFSCIPFVGGFDVENYPASKWEQFDLQWREWQTKEMFPLGGNRELVAQLREWCGQGRATIMLHGIHHDLYEFMQRKDFFEEVRAARQYLESLFDRPVTVASPPNNSLGRSAAVALADNGFNVLTAFGHRPSERPASLRNYVNFSRLLALYAFNGTRYRLRHPLDFGTHKEQGCYEIGPSTSFVDLARAFERVVSRGGNFVVATHYYHLAAQPPLRQMLTDIVALAQGQSSAVEFVTAEQVFS
jgi:hypothetical protein